LSININAIRLTAGGSKHEHIVHLWWNERETGKPGDASRAAVVEFIEGGGNAFVDDRRGHVVAVRVVTPASGPKYVQTCADGIWTDNLLSLPRR
jgi:Protein of unknown function (DUF3892)